MSALSDIAENEINIASEEAYNKGLNDGRNEVWELIKKIEKLPNFRMEELFGCGTIAKIVDKFTLQEVIAKIEAYKTEQAKIKAGDVVTISPRSGGHYNAIVVFTKPEGYIDAIYRDGLTANNVPPQLYRKTGKHIDISKILQQIEE